MVNWQRGLLRGWIVLSAIWIGYWVMVSLSGGLEMFDSSTAKIVFLAVMVIVPLVGVLLLGFIVKWLIAGFGR